MKHRESPHDLSLLPLPHMQSRCGEAMKDEFIYLSKAGAFAVWFAGVMLGIMVATKFDAGSILLVVMLTLLVRNDIRETPMLGRYEQGWIFWQRKGPCK